MTVRKGERPRYVSASVMAKRWGMSVRRVRVLCAKYRVFRAFRDKWTGEWKIPYGAERPTDARAYRYKKVPPHFRDLVQHVDVAVSRLKAHPQRTTEENWLYFVRGSAFHLHTLGTSTLTFSDVCEVVDGKWAEGCDAADQEKVGNLVKALVCVRRAVQEKRRLTMTLVREFASCLLGKRARCESEMSAMQMTELVRGLAHSDAHPLVKAGDALAKVFYLHPYPTVSEVLGCLLANFILMRAGYPPAILYRAIFRTVHDYWAYHRQEVAEYNALKRTKRLILWGKPQEPVKYRAFLNACVARAVLRAVLRGVGPVV